MSSTFVVSAMMTPAQSPVLCDKLGWFGVALEAAEVTKEAGREVTKAHRHWLWERIYKFTAGGRAQFGLATNIF